MSFEQNTGAAPSYWDQLSPGDKNMAIATALMQAGANVTAANQPRYGYGTPTLGNLFSAGAAGGAEGLGNSMAASQQARAQAVKMQADQVKANIEMLKQAKEMQNMQAQEAYFSSLPPEQQALARAARSEYLKWALELTFAPQKSAMAVQEALMKAGMMRDANGQWQYMPGYAESQAGLEGAKAGARGMNTPVAVQQGGTVVMPGMAMNTGSQGGGYSLSPVLDAVRTVESGGNPNAVSPAGAQGPYQFMPATAQQYGVQNPFDEAQSRAGAGQYISDLSQRYGGNMYTALQAYNWGPGNMDAFLRTGRGLPTKQYPEGAPMPKETQEYAQKVFSRMQGQPTTQSGGTRGVLFQGATADLGNQETAFDKKTGEELGARYLGAQDAANGARSQLQRFETLDTLLQGFQSGRFGELRLDAARALKGLGADQLADQLTGGKLGEADAARALQNQIALMFRDPSQGAGMPGAMSDKDRDFLQSMVPGLSSTPEGRKLLIEAQKKVVQRASDVAALWRDQRKRAGGRSTLDVYDELSDLHKTDLFDDTFRQKAVQVAQGGGQAAPQRQPLSSFYQ